MSARDVLLGVDIGTSATKVVAVDESCTVVAAREQPHPLRTRGEQAVHDPELVLGTVINAITGCRQTCAERGYRVAGLSFSAAMHTLLALDRDGVPSTPALSWADNRACAETRRIAADAGDELHRATGTPVHPMSPLTKLAWFHAHEPAVAAEAWCGLKDFVLFWCTDRLTTDLSCASATGLLESSTLDWYSPALDIAGVQARQLPDLVPPTETLPLCADAAEVLGLPAGLPVVAGAGDGPLASLGVGAVLPGAAALSVGTSAALRVARTGPAVDDQRRTFCYYLADDIWVTGGAISNGGIVAQWAADVVGEGDLGRALREAAKIAPGAKGLLALPYLLGERAPWWDPAPRGALFGLRREHTSACIVRALVEGVVQQVALVRDAVLDSGASLNTVRATGGALRDPLWTSLLAAALDLPLEITQDTEGSGFGAALLGWRALGHLPSLYDAAAVVRPSRTVTPDPATAKHLASARPLAERAYRLVRELSATGAAGHVFVHQSGVPAER